MYCIVTQDFKIKNFIKMKLINKLGVMQGRLTPMIGNKIQSFPKKKLAKLIGWVWKCGNA